MGPAVLYRYEPDPGGWFMFLRSPEVSELYGCGTRHGFPRHDVYGLAWLAALALGLFVLAFSPARAEGFAPGQKTEIE